MTSIADIDILIAALYPHIYQARVENLISPTSSLQPSENSTAVHSFVDSFAELFHFYPDCKTAAVASQSLLHQKMSLYICPSAPTPAGFEADVKRWFTQFMDTRTASIEKADSERERFIIDVYSLCYAKMRQGAVVDDRVWTLFVNLSEPKNEKERGRRKAVSEKLANLSTLVESFVDTISREKPSLGVETRQFHDVCVNICDAMKDNELKDYINKYLYVLGVDYLLQRFFRLPIAISNLLSSATKPELPFDGECPITVVDAGKLGARQFKALLSAENLQEILPGDVDWDEVRNAFIEDESGTLIEGLYWNPSDFVLSTGAPVTPHPEVTLIQDLLNKHNCDSDQGAAVTVYIACSTTPCYATVVYAAAINNVLQDRGKSFKFTLRTDDLTWCRLSTADPWILVNMAEKDIVERLKETLLSELRNMMDVWEKEQLFY
ncbi:hypothetical protein GSI_08345 [Ganoderma sinense ZZ0214-1]|uniref:Uncharacterized protein n=1 Tax=Ganoderma sinense ZZ0214-1 TaxID=1077348 RepID=A0A2G8S732_9APHY|nr:hypothetical protein GSI_08345 [Ganoderma sinense ZZ0214-1]